MSYKSVFEIDSYREACAYLQNKYGVPETDYYHIGKKGKLTLCVTSRGQEGLQCHHICEDTVPGLSSKEQAEKYWNEHPEYQAKENLCYCNLFEHTYLHILITEAAVKNSDEEEGNCLGNSGVKWMFLALNSILADPKTSWYSIKNYINEENSDVEELRGLRYNYENLITDNIDIYRKLVNKYCTSAFIRLKLGKTPEELGNELCKLFCKKDASGCNAVRDLINIECRNTKLFNWNVNAFVDLEMYLRENKTTLVNICTGGGKTTTALEYCRVHNCEALVLGPKDVVGDSWKNIDNIDYVNYQTFMNPDFYKNQDYSKYGAIIADEAHHTKADRWSEGLDWVIENTNLPIIGLTATLSKEQSEGKDDLFQGRIAYGLELADGIAQGNIYPFSYVQSIYGFTENKKLKEEFDKAGPTGTILWKNLNVSLNQNPIEKILKDKMPPQKPRKIICFAQSIDDEDIAYNAMKAYDPNLKIYVIDSRKQRSGEIDCDKIRSEFNSETEHDICLINVGMVSEGAHYNEVNTLVTFRRTQSSTLYLQQLGRIVCTTKKENPHGIVFDFTNNAESLIAAKQMYESSSARSSQLEKLKDTLKKIKEEGTDIILEDYTQDCVQVLLQLREARDTNLLNCKIYNNLVQNVPEDLVSDYFDFDSWEDLKSKGNNKGISSNSSKKSKAKRARIVNYDLPKTKTTSATSSQQEQVAKAFTFVVKWCYMLDIIKFADNQKCDITILDKEKFENTCRRYGFKNSSVISDTFNMMPVVCYTIATTL